MDATLTRIAKLNQKMFLTDPKRLLQKAEAVFGVRQRSALTFSFLQKTKKILYCVQVKKKKLESTSKVKLILRGHGVGI